jgi:3-oxoacyl-[acyl-carrier-protein] synthase II
MDTFIHFGIAAAAQAVADSGLPTGDALSEEAATRIGCNIGHYQSWQRGCGVYGLDSARHLYAESGHQHIGQSDGYGGLFSGVHQRRSV